MPAAALVCNAVMCACNTLATAACNKASGLKKLKEAKFGDAGGSSKVVPLSDDNTRVVYFVRDTYNPKNIINVLDENKCRVYSFERNSKGKFCGIKGEKFVPWDMITANHRQVIGAVGFKKGKAWVEFCNKGDLQFRLIKSLGSCKKKFQQFKYRSDEKARFRWYQRTMTLDKVSPSLEPKSCRMYRQRVAIARKLSFLQCKSPIKKCLQKCQSFTIVDYEVVYDACLIDRELLVATAFVSMMTQWSKMKKSVSVGSGKGGKSGCCVSAKKAKIKMAKYKAMVKAKRILNKGCQTTDMKTSMGLEKVACAKSMAYKFMGGKVAPTSENPSGDPTFKTKKCKKPTKPALVCAKKLCEKPLACMPNCVPTCLPIPRPSACPSTGPSCSRPMTAASCGVPKCPAPPMPQAYRGGACPTPQVCIVPPGAFPVQQQQQQTYYYNPMMQVPPSAPQAQCSINIQPQPSYCPMPTYSQLAPPPASAPLPISSNYNANFYGYFDQQQPLASSCALARPGSSSMCPASTCSTFCPPRPPTPYSECAPSPGMCRPSSRSSTRSGCCGSSGPTACRKRKRTSCKSGCKASPESYCGNEMKRGFYQ